MKVFGMIVASKGCPAIARQQWLEVCTGHPALFAIPPIVRPNPFKPGQTMTVRSPAGTVRVVSAGRDLGWMEWAQDDTPLINVWGDDREIIPIAEEIASRLSAQFIEEESYPGDEADSDPP